MAKETKEAILIAAEILFGKHGFDNVSVRDITNKAGVNLSALSYHFSDKSGLMEEVIVNSVQKLNINRQNLLSKAQIDHDENPPLRVVIEAFLAPIFLPEIHQTHPNIIAALMAKTLVKKKEHNPYNHPIFSNTIQLFHQAFKKACPKIRDEHLPYLMKMMSGAAVTLRTFTYSSQGLKEMKISAEIYENEFKLLIDFCENGVKSILTSSSSSSEKKKK